jgi:parallel beta-helix repeat protein
MIRIRSLFLLAAAPALAVAQIPIKSLPYVIEKPGSYALVRSLTTDGGGIIVAASHVSIDLGGFVLMGNRASGDGIALRGSQSDLAVFNGSITGWSGDGIEADEGLNVNLHDLRVSGNGACGLRAGHGAIVSNVVLLANGGSGLVSFEGLVATGLSSTNNALWGLEAGTGAVLTGNSIVGNFAGGMLVENSSRVTGNSVVNNGLLGGDRSADDCTAGTLAGIAVSGEGSMVMDNVVTGNGLGLQLMKGGNEVAGNVVKQNRANYQFVEGNQLDLVVSELPLRVEWPAVVRLAGTLIAHDGDGIIVAATGVTIDLGGHDLLARDGSGTGILVEGDVMALTVRNGTVAGWSGAGIDARTATGSLFEKLTLHKNGEWGLRTGSGSKVMDVVAHMNLKDGILTDADTLVQGCTVTNNGNDGLHLGNHSMAMNCVASENYLFGIRVFSGAMVKDCTASHNNMGISADDGATIQDCTTSFNTLIGIRITSSSIVEGNTVQNNDTGIAVLDGPGSRVAHNNLTGNKTGLLLSSTGNLCYCNSAASNGTNYMIADGNAAARVYEVTGDASFWVADPWGNLSY